jgi:glycosyltransferase involved in cell wall biosynthesis
MRKIRIFGFPSHTTKERLSGVDFARVIQPMKALNGYKDGEIEIETTVFDPHEKTDWLHVANNYDVIYFNYLNDPWGFAAMGAMARKKGLKLVMDLDDSLWNLKSDNPAHAVYQSGSEALKNFTLIANEVDYITCTNDYLKHVIMNNTKKSSPTLQVFPNFIDLDFYNHRSKPKDNGQITLLHYGSTTHFNDLAEWEFMKGIERVMSTYPNVSIKFVGAFIPQFRERWGARYQNAFGAEHLERWVKDKFPAYMDEADILVVPLTDDVYNRCKSSIKFLEASSAKVPGVYQKIRQYEEVIEEGKNGFLAEKDTHWFKAIKKLIDDVELRRSVGEEAFKTVESDWQMKDNLKTYADFFKEITAREKG